MNDDVTASRLRISRRRALALGGSVGLGALIAACTSQSGGTATGSTAGVSPPTTAGTMGASAAQITTPGSAVAVVSTTVPVSSVAGSGSGSVQTSTVTSPDVLALLDSASTCTLTPAETEGPYYIDLDAIRTDVREDRPGAELILAIRVQDASCAAIPGAVVEIWHCDAGGVYSGFASASLGGGGSGAQPGAGPGGPPGGGAPGGGGGGSATVTDDGTYLRGAQVTNDAGVAQFTTIYPGWYQGRTVHIHFKVHVDEQTLLTSQLYFEDAMSDALFAGTGPYEAHSGNRTTNDEDGIFDSSLIVTAHQAVGAYLAVKNVTVSAS